MSDAPSQEFYKNLTERLPKIAESQEESGNEVVSQGFYCTITLVEPALKRVGDECPRLHASSDQIKRISQLVDRCFESKGGFPIELAVETTRAIITVHC